MPSQWLQGVYALLQAYRPPQLGDDLFGGLTAVEPWPESVNGKALLDDLKQWLVNEERTGSSSDSASGGGQQARTTRKEMTLERRRAAKQRRKSREEMPDRPSGSMHNGKGINRSWLPEQLEPFAIRPRAMRIGHLQVKG